VPAVVDPTTIEALYRELAPVMRRRFALAPDEAEDLFQETFVRLLTRPPATAVNLRGWLVRVFTNLAHDRFRAGGGTLPLDAERLAHDQEATVTETEQVVASWLEGYMAKLPASYADAVRAADLEGGSMRAVAARTGLSLSGAKSRVQLGRRMLHQLLVDCCHFERDRFGRLSGYSCRTETCQSGSPRSGRETSQAIK